METQREKVYRLLKSQPLLRTQEITNHGVDRKTIQRMVEKGELIRISRGFYADPNHLPGIHYSIAEAQKTVKHGVICLLSALSFHQIGTQNPSQIWMAIPRSTRLPSPGSVPIKLVTFSGRAFEEGILEEIVDGIKIRIYDIPKTIADCFKFRNKVGLDVAIEALKDVIQNKRSSVDDILYYAEIRRVRNVITPYLESIL